MVSQNPGVVLICWEHDHIPPLASSLPAVAGTVIPPSWPDNRFDVTWVFTLATAGAAGAAGTRYVFSQVPQQLLSGNAGTVIEA